MIHLLSEYPAKLEEARAHYEEELSKIRAGRAAPAMVEDVVAEAYGARTPLKQLASISAPDPKTIQIQPWDVQLMKHIEKALVVANLGMTPTVDGMIIRLNLPQMTADRREELTKQVGKRAEEARIAVRQVRDEAVKILREAQKEKTISEDDEFFGKKELQDVVDGVNEKIKSLEEQKKKELLTI
ncbi:MAG: ribosome recycling factor [Patescibacteria group bacterium]